MRKGILTSYDEPTDEELNFLMREVAEEVIKKSNISSKMMQIRITKEIELAYASFKEKRK